MEHKQENLMAYFRRGEGQSLLVAGNMQKEGQDMALPGPVKAILLNNLEELMSGTMFSAWPPGSSWCWRSEGLLPHRTGWITDRQSCWNYPKEPLIDRFDLFRSSQSGGCGVSV